MTETPSRPTGRTAVRAAVLDNAVALFAERGPASVSLRDIAGAANVNLGLLHRHFGSKAELVTAAMHHFRARSRAKVRAAMEGPDFATAIIQLFRDEGALYPRLMAWSLLDNMDPENLQDSYPTVLALVARLVEKGFDPALARARAAAIFATAVGFAFYEPALRVAAELDTVPDPLIDETVANAVRALLEPPAASS